MSISDCEKCWETPCICGYNYEGWNELRKLKLIEAIVIGRYKRGVNEKVDHILKYFDSFVENEESRERMRCFLKNIKDLS